MTTMPCRYYASVHYLQLTIHSNVPAKKIYYALFNTPAYGGSAFPIRSVIDFNKDWKFLLGNDSTSIENNYNDADWRTLSLPHDWSIEGSFEEKNRPLHKVELCPVALAGTVNHLPCLQERSRKRYSLSLMVSTATVKCGSMGIGWASAPMDTFLLAMS